MFVLIFRTLFIYILIIAAMRLMGKKQLGELQPSELVSAIMLSNLASISIESPEIPLLAGIIPVVIIVCSEILLSGICVHSHRIARIISGGPRVIIRNGIIDQQALHDLRFTVDDLLESLHSKDIFELSDVAFALIETNGSLSIMKHFAKDTPNNQNLKIPPPAASQPSLPLIANGEINKDNMLLCNVDEDWIHTQCASAGISIKDTLLMLCNNAGEYSITKKESR